MARLNMLKNKKGIEAKILVLIILILIGSLIIFTWLPQLLNKGTIDEAACSQSVTYRALLNKVPGTGEGAKRAIPLNCKTVDININSNYKDETEIEKQVSESMYQCWSMLGKGKLDFFDESYWKKAHLGTTQSACIICSRIKFDKNIQNKYSSIDITDYMQKTKIPLSDLTYMQYFSDEQGVEGGTGIRLVPLDTSKEYAIIYMGIKGESVEKLLKSDAGLIGGTGLLAWGIGGPGLVGALGKGILSVAGKPVLLATLIFQEAFTIQGEIAAAMHCGGEEDPTLGCNLAVLTEYNPSDISKYCDNIENIP